MTDALLLEKFVRDGDRAAFAQLVRSHVDWVCSMATRLVRDPATAQDVTQAVFITLARKAKSLRKEARLETWLFTVTRYGAANARRREICRRIKEKEAAIMRAATTQPEPAPAWEELAPILDELVGHLRAADRQAVLLRFYQGKSFPQIGEAMQISEEAARKRVSRAVDQLRASFDRRGVTIGATALTGILAAHTTKPASAAVIGSALSAPSGAAAGAAPLAKALFFGFGFKSLAAGVVCGMLAIVASAIVLQISLVPGKPAKAAESPATAPSAPPAAITGLCYGRVFDDDDKPVANVHIWKTVWNPGTEKDEIGETSQTDAEGNFAFKPQEDTYGGPPSVNVLIDAGPDRAYAAGTVYSPVDSAPTEFHVRPAADARVHFVDPDGKPAAGIRVSINECGGRYQERTFLPDPFQKTIALTTDANGDCTFSGVPKVGQLLLAVLDDRYATISYDNALPLTQKNGAVYTQKLESGAGVSGTVTYADTGKPATGILVWARANTNSGRYSTAVTDEAGHYSITQLHPDKYCVFAFLSDEMSKKVAAQALENLQPKAGENLDHQDLRLISGGIVTGKVFDKTGNKSVPGVNIFVDGPSRPGYTYTIQEAKTDENGVYMIHVPPGQQRVQIAFPLPVGMVQPKQTSFDITVADGQSVAVDYPVQFKPAPPVEGRAVDLNGKPVAGAEISVQRKDAAPEEGEAVAVSGADGSFEIYAVEPGSLLRARRGNWSTVQPVRFDGGEAVVTLQPKALGALHVVVRDTDSKPIAGAHIDVLTGRMNAMYVADGDTTDDGSVILKRLAPDITYEVHITADGYGFHRASANVDPGTQTELEPIVLPKADSFIEGNVIDQDGNPVANIDVHAGSQNMLNRTAKTDSAGHFRIDLIVEGEPVDVIAWDKQKEIQGSANRVAPGSTDVAITVKPTKN